MQPFNCEDHSGDWVCGSEISDVDCPLVRPDQHVAWHIFKPSSSAENDLGKALNKILGH